MTFLNFPVLLYTKVKTITSVKSIFGDFFIMNGVSVLICEFNPLHSGHRYILEKLGETGDVRVCIMSGNFVQRGESAVLDKYTRAKAAVECGADLVLELPFPWCASPAEFFSLGAITVARAVGAERMVFGSECGDIEKLKAVSRKSISEEFLSQVEKEYESSTGYAKARMIAAEKTMPEAAEIFSSSNDMLAVEYLKCAAKCGFEPDFEAVLRRTGERYPSAEKIRKAVIEGGRNVECETYPDFGFLKENVLDPRRLFDIERTVFSLEKNSDKSFDFKSGILRRLSAAAAESTDGAEMLKIAATKKYTDSRIRRAALMSVLNVGENAVRTPPCFTVLLGANKAGRRLVSSLVGELSVVTKPSAVGALNSTAKAQYEIQQRADRLYALCKGVETSYFLKCKPFIVE